MSGHVELWAWDTTNDCWVKIKTDSQGRLYTVAVIDSLDDIGDVELAGIADDDVIYWDAAAGDWLPIAHLGVANAHHAKYTDANARSAMGALGDANPYHHDRAAEWGATEHTAVGDAAPHHAKYTGGEAVSAVEAAGLALASGKNIKVISILTSDHTWSGITAKMYARDAFTIGQVGYASTETGNKLAKADAAATMPAIALATGTIADDAEGEFLLLGFFRDDTWGWTIGGLLYVDEDTAGLLTQALPAAAGEQVQVVGVAIATDFIYFNPSLELVEIPA